jgi:AcrR family transcriptional regulator
MEYGASCSRCQAVDVRRPNRREVAAAETRREILRAARRLFAEHGFASTSVQRIAEEAGVAVQTIYSSVGSKSALVLALNDLIDEESGLPDLAAELFSESKPALMIAKAVHMTRQLNERCGDLMWALESAAPTEPDAAAVFAEGMRRHGRGSSAIAARLADLGALRADLTPDRAAAVLSMMRSSAGWRQLTQGSGWSYDEAEAWLTAALTQLLLQRPRTTYLHYR